MVKLIFVLVFMFLGAVVGSGGLIYNNLFQIAFGALIGLGISGFILAILSRRG
jgi:hypothetical protein